MSDKELQTVTIRRRTLFKMAKDITEYIRDITPSDELIQKLRDRGTDIFTFLERKWCHTIPNPPESWAKTQDNIALFHVTTYKEWLETVGKKTRNMIRKAEKSGIRTDIVVPSDKLGQGIWRIFNETPIRQERGFPHYGTSLETVKKGLFSQSNCTYIGAYFQDELAGFINLIHGDNIAIISQILSLQKHWDKAVNNSLVAKAIEVCANKHIEWIMYGRIGNHPSLDIFKENNGFSRFPLTRYYMPLTRKGKIALSLGLHRELKDALPQSIKYRLIPIYNWISRTKMRIRLLKPSKTVS
jgi:hypothetical protein